MSSLPDWNAEFPKCRKTPFDERIANTITASGVDLLENCLRYDPKDRITAMDCLSHIYFNALDK